MFDSKYSVFMYNNCNRLVWCDEFDKVDLKMLGWYVCFVCGSLGVEFLLWIKLYDRLFYFFFLNIMIYLKEFGYWLVMVMWIVVECVMFFWFNSGRFTSG